MSLTTRNKNRKGFALLAVLAFISVVLILSALLVSASLAELESSRRSTNNVEARVIGTQALDEFFSRLIADPNYLGTPLAAVTGSQIPLGSTPAGSGGARHPGLRLPGDVTNAVWARIDPITGIPEPCAATDYDNPCYYLTVRRGVVAPSSNAAPGASGKRTIRIEVTTRTGCFGAARGCEYARQQMLVRERSYLDYLYTSEYETLDPAIPGGYTIRASTPTDLAAAGPLGTPSAASLCANKTYSARDTRCKTVAFLGPSASGNLIGQGDQVTIGAIYTNDEAIAVCGNPAFSGNVVTVTASGVTPPLPPAIPNPSLAGPGYYPADGTACATDSMPNFISGGPLVGPRLTLPTSTSVATLQGLASGLYSITPPGPTQITAVSVSGSTLSINGALSIPLPPNGLLYVDGPVSITSVAALDGRLTVVSGGAAGTPNGNVNLDGNITRANSNSYFGVIANNSVVIGRPTPLVVDRTIEGVLVAVNGSIYVQDWFASILTNSPTCSANTTFSFPSCPTLWYTQGSQTPASLTFRGSMISKYRGVFAGYNSSGIQIAGFRKDFEYDPRLASDQPPFFTSTALNRWERLDIAEVNTGGPARLAGNVYLPPLGGMDSN